jgi:hypothetical protein
LRFFNMFGSTMYLMEGYLFFGEPLMHANAREWFDRLTNVVRQCTITSWHGSESVGRFITNASILAFCQTPSDA